MNIGININKVEVVVRRCRILSKPSTKKFGRRRPLLNIVKGVVPVMPDQTKIFNSLVHKRDHRAKHLLRINKGIRLARLGSKISIIDKGANNKRIF